MSKSKGVPKPAKTPQTKTTKPTKQKLTPEDEVRYLQERLATYEEYRVVVEKQMEKQKEIDKLNELRDDVKGVEQVGKEIESLEALVHVKKKEEGLTQENQVLTEKNEKLKNDIIGDLLNRIDNKKSTKEIELIPAEKKVPQEFLGIARLAAQQVLTEKGERKDLISQNDAWKFYGRNTVTDLLKHGSIKRTSGKGGNSKCTYSRMEIDAALYSLEASKQGYKIKGFNKALEGIQKAS
jgi:hypothetical protein